METPFLLERYRRDRRNLLEFLLSEGLIRAPSRTSIDLAGLDLDSISADYVLDCIESGEELILRRLRGEPEISGSPPRRAAPRLSSGVKITTNGTSSTCRESLIGRDVGISGESRTKGVATTDEPSRLLEDKNILSLGLPGLSTVFGFLKEFLMMKFEKQHTRSFLLVCSVGEKYIFPKR